MAYVERGDNNHEDCRDHSEDGMFKEESKVVLVSSLWPKLLVVGGDGRQRPAYNVHHDHFGGDEHW